MLLVLELDHGFLALVFTDAFKRHAAEVEAVARLAQHVGDFTLEEAEGPAFTEEELLGIVGVGRRTNDAAELLRVIDCANDDARLHFLAAHGRCERGHLAAACGGDFTADFLGPVVVDSREYRAVALSHRQ